MDARTVLGRGLATGLRLGRGAADRVVTVAGPTLARLGDKAVSRLRGQEPQAGTATFTPSRAPETPAAEPAPAPETAPAPKGPSPASVARNVAPERPTVKPPTSPKPASAPGAKLPPRRPATS